MWLPLKSFGEINKLKVLLGRPSDMQRLISLSFPLHSSLSVLSPESKDHINGEKEHSACKRAVQRRSTMSSNDLKHDDVE
ncbi:hypothetical protein H5410_041381 [Solanum commersonii]|uniref:Uncharacterized protein n=1 Tax=Solanum commersonii TaxID=4109 RepID=A0A9J5XRE9_SOLCO|nr:hypothetical protein H5410_041381 [Solanum commersonii]